MRSHAAATNTPRVHAASTPAGRRHSIQSESGGARARLLDLDQTAGAADRPEGVGSRHAGRDRPGP